MRPILFLTKLDAGGMERVCVTLCNQWARQGRDVSLYVSYPGGASAGDLDRRVDVINANRSSRCAAVLICRVCRAQPKAPLLVLSAELGVVILLLKRLRLIVNPVVYRESTAVLSHCSGFWKWVIAKIISRADGIIVQSQRTLDDLEALFCIRQPVALIRNPCAFVEKVPVHAFQIVRTCRRFPLNLLVIGRLEPMKGHVRLLQALSRLTTFDWRMKIVGSGSMEQTLQEEILKLGMASRVKLTGFIKDTRPEYESADLVVIPSYYEGLPNVLIEALACGCPVLVAKGGGGTMEFMHELGLDEFVIESDDFERDFASGVECVLKSDQDVWLHAYERMTAQVHPEIIANQVWDFLETTK